MSKLKEIKKKYIPSFFIASASILLISVVLIRIAMSSERVADAFNSTILHAYRRTLAFLTDLLPFSLFEIVIALIPVFLVAVVVFGVRAMRRGRKIPFILTLTGILFLLYSAYLWGLSMPYHVSDIDKKMELDDTEVTSDSIYRVMLTLRDELNAHAALVGDVGEDGATVMPYSFATLGEKLNLAYTDFSAEYPEVLKNYTSRPKEMIFGYAMSELHLVGVYSFFTGEANISTDYPDYNTPYTVAHEMAHQRGIIRENEANFVAFLVCISSDDAYIRYSAYLNMLEYLATALNKTAPEKWREVSKTLDPKAVGDIKASSAVYQAHEDSLYGKLMNSFNDSYIKNNGSPGVVSYSLVVRLIVAYYTDRVGN